MHPNRLAFARMMVEAKGTHPIVGELLTEVERRVEPSAIETVQVVAAVRCEHGKFWCCRRTDDGGHGGLAGMWEYPGGKVEAGETLEEGLRREMREEFGVEIDILQQLDTIGAEQWGKRYEVTFFSVMFRELPVLRVHDQADWFDVLQLQQMQHLPSGTEFNRRLAVYRGSTPSKSMLAGRWLVAMELDHDGTFRCLPQ